MPPSANRSTANKCVEVFYLRIDPHLGGFRWLVAKSGCAEPVAVSASIFPSDHSAKASGRVGMDRFMRENSYACVRTSADLGDYHVFIP